jgi:hypothetical protein
MPASGTFLPLPARLITASPLTTDTMEEDSRSGFGAVGSDAGRMGPMAPQRGVRATPTLQPREFRGYSYSMRAPQMAKNAAKTSERFVSATELARSIDVSRPYNKLESEGVIRRTPKGFPLDASVIDYIPIYDVSDHRLPEQPPTPRLRRRGGLSCGSWRRKKR